MSKIKLQLQFKCWFTVWFLQTGVVDKRRLMLLLELFYNKMTKELKNSLANPKRCKFSACKLF